MSKTVSLLKRIAMALVLSGVSVPLAVAQDAGQPPAGSRESRGHQSQVALGVDVVSMPGKGVVVTQVREGSPADKIGLRPGDQIVSFAGQEVSNPQDLLSQIRKQQSGKTVKADVIRDGERIDMAIVLAAGQTAIDRDVTEQQQQQQQRDRGARQQRPGDPQAGRPEQQRSPRDEPMPPRNGLRERGQQQPPPNQRQGQQQQQQQQQRQTRYQPPQVWAGFILERAALGVLIERIHPRGPARRAGLLEGDRIVKANGQVVSEPEEVYQAVEQQQPGSELQVTVLRNDRPIEITVPIEAMPREIAERPAGGPPTGQGMNAPDFVQTLMQQQQQNRQMIRELMREVDRLRQELQSMQSDRGAGARAESGRAPDVGVTVPQEAVRQPQGTDR